MQISVSATHNTTRGIPTLLQHAKQRTIFRLFIRGSVAIFPHQRRRLELLYTPHAPHTNPPPHTPHTPKNPATTRKPRPRQPPHRPKRRKRVSVYWLTHLRWRSWQASHAVEQTLNLEKELPAAVGQGHHVTERAFRNLQLQAVQRPADVRIEVPGDVQRHRLSVVHPEAGRVQRVRDDPLPAGPRTGWSPQAASGPRCGSPGPSPRPPGRPLPWRRSPRVGGRRRASCVPPATGPAVPCSSAAASRPASAAGASERAVSGFRGSPHRASGRTSRGRGQPR